MNTPIPPASRTATKPTVPLLLIEGAERKLENIPLGSAMVVKGPPFPVKMPFSALVLKIAKNVTVPLLLIEGPPKLENVDVSAMVVVELALLVKIPKPPTSRRPENATVPPSFIATPLKLEKPPLESTLVVRGPPFPVKTPLPPSLSRRAENATVPLLFIEIPESKLGNAPLTTIVVKAPPLPVKMPASPSSNPPKNATIPLSFIKAAVLKPENAPLVSAIVVKV